MMNSKTQLVIWLIILIILFVGTAILLIMFPVTPNPNQEIPNPYHMAPWGN